jgi:hypothetical protein
MLGLAFTAAMTWKSYALVSGAGVVATYMVSSPLPRTDSPALARPAATRMEVASDIQEQAVRLEARLRRQAPYQEPARNPFRFSQRRAPQSALVPEAGAAPVIAVAPAARQLEAIALVGIAEDETDGRTAILKTSQGIVFVRTGDAVGAEYTVGAIEASAIDLVGTDGAVRRISAAP